MPLRAPPPQDGAYANSATCANLVVPRGLEPLTVANQATTFPTTPQDHKTGEGICYAGSLRACYRLTVARRVRVTAQPGLLAGVTLEAAPSAHRGPSYRLLRSWSGRWGSNPRPFPWQGNALPLSYARIRRFLTLTLHGQHLFYDRRCATDFLERIAGVEPAPAGWKPDMLP